MQIPSAQYLLNAAYDNFITLPYTLDNFMQLASPHLVTYCSFCNGFDQHFWIDLIKVDVLLLYKTSIKKELITQYLHFTLSLSLITTRIDFGIERLIHSINDLFDV